MKLSRREIIIAATGLGAATVGGILTLAAQTSKTPGASRAAPAQQKSTSILDEPNSPPEYIMLEHALIERLLLIYDECVRRLRANESFPAAALHEAADTIRKFAEEYHEKREDKIFDHFTAHSDYTALIKTLKAHHKAGQTLTEKILANASAEKISNPDARKTLIEACESYVRMMRPHMAREATELFQAVYEILPAPALDALSTELMKNEEQVLGKEEGFDKMVEHISGIEQQLGIHDLDQFIPKT